MTCSWAVDIFLQPGEWYFGDRHTRIRTVLGSCVAVTLWHPRRRVGGMCHYMLPGRPAGSGDVHDGRYASDAFALLLGEAVRSGSRPDEYEVKMFGGGNMFPWRAHGRHIGLQNAEAGHSLVRRHGMHCKARDVGGCGHRNVILDVDSGHVWVMRMPPRLAGPD